MTDRKGRKECEEYKDNVRKRTNVCTRYASPQTLFFAISAISASFALSLSDQEP